MHQVHTLNPGCAHRPRVLRPCLALLCHNTISCIVTLAPNMGSSPSSCQKLFLSRFFSLFFFILATRKSPTKNILFFSFSSKPNKFIKIYLIYFSFSSFTHCKTLEKNFLHIIFFSFNSGLFAQNFSNNLFSHLTLVFNIFIFSYVLFTKHTNHTTHNNSCYAHHSHINHTIT